jgi:hypothetical protein
VDTNDPPSKPRTARITRGAKVVAAQAHCSTYEALMLMNSRALGSRTSIEIVAIAVVVGDIHFDSREFSTEESHPNAASS